MSSPLRVCFHEQKSPSRFDKKWEIADPTVNANELFRELDGKYFKNKMKKNGVLLEWSEKASSTASYCYKLDDGDKDNKRCYIVLNKTLLRLRSRTDLVETLLHGMIHAVIFIKGIDENHGPNFRRIMKNINKAAGTKMTIGHEIDHYKDLARRHAGFTPSHLPPLSKNQIIELCIGADSKRRIKLIGYEDDSECDTCEFESDSSSSDSNSETNSEANSGSSDSDSDDSDSSSSECYCGNCVK